MFYDQAANDGQPMSVMRIAMSLATILLIPPFIVLAIAPMLLLMLPVAFVAIPFMIPAFFPAAHATQVEVRQLSWRPRLGMALQHAPHH